MPETGNSLNLERGALYMLRNGYVPEYTFASDYTITTYYSLSPDNPGNPEEVHVPDMQDTPPMAGIPGREPPEMGFHFPRQPFETGKIITDSDWKRALCMPVNPAHMSAGSTGIFRKILDPVKSGSLTSIISERTGRNLARSRETAGIYTAKQMELPRGKFRALKRSTILLFLIRDLRKEAFTGYCKIPHGERIMVLVFGKGTIMLAASDNLGGDPAINEICTYKYSWVDAMLHDLDDAQLQLALEFNPSHRLTEEPGSLSEEPEKVPDLQALHRFEERIEPGNLYPEQDEKEQPGLNQIEDTFAELQPPFTSRSVPSLQEEEAGWKKALIMEITPGSNGKEIIQESSKEIETDASADLLDKIMISRLKSEPISFDSDLFERKALDLQPARIAAPERKELWRSMKINRLQNYSV